jgi:hypothetical protein
LSVVVVWWLWALVSSILLGGWRAVVLLRWISLLGRTAIAALRRWCAVAATTTVILLSGIIRHVELRSGGGEEEAALEAFVERSSTDCPFREASLQRLK